MGLNQTPNATSKCPDCQKTTRQPVTIADYVKKWQPLLKEREYTPGIEGRAAEFTAWVLEQEAKYLLHEALKQRSVGLSLKYFFPLLRRIAPSYADCEMPEFDTLVSQFMSEAALISDALIRKQVETGIRQEIPSSDDLSKVIPSMVERLQDSVKNFKNVPR